MMPRMGDYDGLRAWVTGASSGIGAALAEELARRGASLVLSARNAAALNEVAARCGDPARVAVLPLDLARPETLAEASAVAWERHGPIDLVFHNAGLALRELAENTSLEVDRRVFEVNFFGPVALTKALLGRMLARGRGRFVVVSSLSGKYGVPMATAYAASKHALHGWFDSLRAEVAPRGLGVTLVIPGFIATEITRHALRGDGTAFDRQLEVHQTGMSPQRCARIIADQVARGRNEFYVGAEARLSVLVNRLIPSLWRVLIRNHPMAWLRRLKARLGLSRR